MLLIILALSAIVLGYLLALAYWGALVLLSPILDPIKRRVQEARFPRERVRVADIRPSGVLNPVGQNAPDVRQLIIEGPESLEHIVPFRYVFARSNPQDARWHQQF